MKHLFKTNFEILRTTRTVSGGAISETETVSSTVKGVKVPVAGFESFRYGKTTAEVTDRLYCGISEDILKKDRIREEGKTEKFEVIEIKDSVLGINKHKEVELKKVE